LRQVDRFPRMVEHVPQGDERIMLRHRGRGLRKEPGRGSRG
jgi:hypothetical protein